tara:strand:- start:974 stop:2047 length:1074 start_codon:yes stop_codon:yes gene_type:complete
MSEDKNEIIDLKMIYKKVLHNRISIFKWTILSFFIGLFFAFITPPKYTSSISFVPQIENSDNNQVSNIASIAGISLSNNNSNYIQPNLYPRIIRDLKFKRDVLNMYVNNNITLKSYISNKEKTIYEYVLNYSVGLPQFVFQNIKSLLFSTDTSVSNKVINNDDEFYVSDEELQLLKYLDKIIKINVDDNDGFVELIVEFDDPKISTIIVLNYQKILQKYIIDYKIKSSLEILNFTENALKIKKFEFEKIQNELAEFKDNNQNISTSVFNTQLFKLQNKFDLESSLYENLTQKVSQAKIDVTRNTPIFTVIENPIIPISRNNSRLKILIQFTLLGSISYLIFLLTRDRTLQIYKYLNK